MPFSDGVGNEPSSDIILAESSSSEAAPRSADFDSGATWKFWLARELAKVKDPKRRNWLKEVAFAGSGGYRRFLRLMETRKGALEFNTGEWPKTIRKLTNKQIKARRRKCIGGCGGLINPRFTPWGELFDDFEPICRSCRQAKDRKKTDMSENQPTNTNPSEAFSRIEEALKMIEANKLSLKTDLRNILLEAKNKLNVLLSPSVGFTFEQIFSDPEFEEIVVAFGIRFRETTAKSTAATPANPKRKSKVKSNDDGDLGAAIVKLMKDGVERSRPAIKSDLKEKQGVKVKTEHNYAVTKLVKEGRLTESGKGRNAVFKIAA